VHLVCGQQPRLARDGGDPDLAARALASAGPSWPALQAVGYDRFAAAIREAIRPLYTEGLGVRIVSEFGWIMGRVPSA